VITNAIVQRDAIGDAPPVANPEGVGRTRDVDVPVSGVLEKVRREVVHARHVPAVRAVHGVSGKAAIEIRRTRAEVVRTAFAEMPRSRLLPPQKFASPLHVVAAARGSSF